MANNNTGIDNTGNGNSGNGKAIEWPDGWGFHALHGVRFDKDPELWQKIVDGKLTASELSKIQDVDQRRQALRYMGGLRGWCGDGVLESLRA